LRISRLLRSGFLDLDFQPELPEPPPDEDSAPSRRYLRDCREQILRGLVERLEPGGGIAHPRRLLRELVARERQFCSAVGDEVAIPHLRTLQVRKMRLGLARSPMGLPFGEGGEPVRLFLLLVGPSGEEAAYLRVFRALAGTLRIPEERQRLMEMDEEWEIMRLLDVG
jgi:mannitol/fructose-specific phosphotransferase system IIA component (Ntr-type)